MFFRVLKLAFIDPFRSRERALIYFFSVIALVGFSFLDVYLAFYLTGKSVKDVALYALTRCFVSNIVLFGILSWLLMKTHPRMMLPVFHAVQIAGLVGLYHITAASGGIYIAVCTALVGVPFWMAYHIMMLKYTSTENRGNEVSVGSSIYFLGGVAGAILAGSALEFADGLWFVFAAAFLIFASTLYFTWHLGIKVGIDDDMRAFHPRRSYWQHIFEQPKRFCKSILAGGGEYLTFFFLPAWMKVMGLGAMTAGAVQGLTLLVRIFVSPLAGHYTHHGKDDEIRVGAGLAAIGWLPWLALKNVWLFPLSSVFWSASAQLYGVGETTNWYKSRSITGLYARETALGIGRSIISIVAGLVLYHSPAAYPVLGFCVAVLMGSVTLWRRPPVIEPA